MSSVEEYRKKLLNELKKYEIEFVGNKLYIKDNRLTQKLLSKQINEKYLYLKNEVERYFVKSVNEIDIKNLKPKLILVTDKRLRNIFNYAKTFWSVPVSSGFGRRLDYILFDEYNNKVIGVCGLCDPVISLKARDSYIGWEKEVKYKRLYNMMTAYILGAVPPYNYYLGAKLVALSIISKEVVSDFFNKYKNKKTIISEEEKLPYLVAIDTMGAFGKSSIYNRLKRWKFVGYTKGQSHIHLTSDKDINDLLVEVVTKFGRKEILEKNKFGDGSNYKLRVISEALNILELSSLKFHNIKRGYYLSELISNFKEFMNMNTDIPIYNVSSIEDNFDYWYNRWFLKRLNNKGVYNEK